MGRERYRQTDRESERDTETGREIHRDTERERVRETHTVRERHRERQRETVRDRELLFVISFFYSLLFWF